MAVETRHLVQIGSVQSGRPRSSGELIGCSGPNPSSWAGGVIGNGRATANRLPSSACAPRKTGSASNSRCESAAAIGRAGARPSRSRMRLPTWRGPPLFPLPWHRQRSPLRVPGGQAQCWRVSFLCRHCCLLAYPSQGECEHDRMMRRTNKQRPRLARLRKLLLHLQRKGHVLGDRHVREQAEMLE